VEYGFVRLADEIVDTFHDYDKERLLQQLENDLEAALQHKISINPLLNSFQHTVLKYNIPNEMIEAFLNSMRLDLSKKDYSEPEYKSYIYGSADVVGLMCLKVFVKGDENKYERLKESAMNLGSAFQKVNFLRDLKTDYEVLNRNYFPDTNLDCLSEENKNRIIQEIEADFKAAYSGIRQLPLEAKFGVYTAYVYYKQLLAKLKQTPSTKIGKTRIRVPDYQKYGLFARCYFSYKLKLV
jgi:phytoene synthase